MFKVGQGTKESEMQTIQVTPETNEMLGIFDLDSYAEISSQEYDSMVKAYENFLEAILVQEGGIEVAYSLSATRRTFLFESNDGRFFVEA